MNDLFFEIVFPSSWLRGIITTDQYYLEIIDVNSPFLHLFIQLSMTFEKSRAFLFGI